MREDWIEVELTEVCDFKGGGTPSKRVAEYWNGDIPWASIKDIKGQFLTSTLDTITQVGIENSSTSLAAPNEIIIATRINPGKPIITKIKTAINQDLKVVKPKIEICTKFLYYAFLTIKRKVLDASSGTTVQGISLINLKEIRILLPPLPEQRAIVAKIEQLFSALDQGVQSLEKAQAQLKVYRQAVLKKAFEGELTKAWREAQTGLPTADELLEEIQLERERYYGQQMMEWEEAVTAWESGGKVGRKPGKPRGYKKLLRREEDKSQGPMMPLTWKLEKLSNCIIEGPTNGYSPKSIGSNTGTKSLKLTATTSRKFLINETSIKFLGFDIPKESKYWLKDNDILIQRANTIDYVGATAIFKESFGEFIYPDLMIRIRVGKKINPLFMAHYLNSFFCQKYFRKNATGTAGNMPKINGVTLSNTPLPLCSIQEQHQIVQEIESRLSVCDKLEESIQENLQKAEALRQSILKKAFEGRLLSEAELAACRQEADWEPAADLLARIKEEKN